VAQANGELMRPLRGLPATHCPLAPLANNTLQATILPANSHALRALRVAGRIAPELAIMFLERRDHEVAQKTNP